MDQSQYFKKLSLTVGTEICKFNDKYQFQANQTLKLNENETLSLTDLSTCDDNCN